MRRAPAVDVKAIAAAIPPYRAPARRDWTPGWRVAAAVVAIAAGGTSIVLLRTSTPVVRQDVTPYVQAVPTPHREPATVAAPQPTRPWGVAPASPVPRTQPAAVVTRELAIEGGSIGDLSDGELSALVEGIESLDGLPSTEVEAWSRCRSARRRESDASHHSRDRARTAAAGGRPGGAGGPTSSRRRAPDRSRRRGSSSRRGCARASGASRRIASGSRTTDVEAVADESAVRRAATRARDAGA